MIFLIYLWLCWVFSLVAESGGYSRCGAWTSHCGGFSWSRAWALGWVGFSSCDAAGSVVAAHGLSCSAPCGIFPDQGSNPRLLRGQADSLPLSQQGSPSNFVYYIFVQNPREEIYFIQPYSKPWIKSYTKQYLTFPLSILIFSIIFSFVLFLAALCGIQYFPYQTGPPRKVSLSFFKKVLLWAHSWLEVWKRSLY